MDPCFSVKIGEIVDHDISIFVDIEGVSVDHHKLHTIRQGVVVKLDERMVECRVARDA